MSIFTLKARLLSKLDDAYIRARHRVLDMLLRIAVRSTKRLVQMNHKPDEQLLQNIVAWQFYRDPGHGGLDPNAPNAQEVWELIFLQHCRYVTPEQLTEHLMKD